MAKTDSVPYSFRFRADVGFMLDDLAERWKCTKTAAAERAILEAHESLFSASVTPTPHQIAIADGLYPRPGTIPAGQYPCRCVHSGCQGAKFQGVSKFANLCPECQEKGHSGDPKVCQECYTDIGPA